MIIIISTSSRQGKGKRAVENQYPIGWGWWPVGSEGAPEHDYDHPRGRIPIVATFLAHHMAVVKQKIDS